MKPSSLLPVALVAAPFAAHAAELPGMTPGVAEVARSGESVTLKNAVFSASWTVRDGRPEPAEISDLTAGLKLSQAGRPLFRLKTEAGEISSATMRPVGGIRVSDIAANPRAPRACDRFAGKAVTASFADAASGITVHWRALLRDGSNYVRQEFVITGTKPATIVELALQDVAVPGAKQVGTVPGSPVTAGNLFFGVEQPMTKNTVAPDGFSSGFACRLPVDAKAKYAFGTVAGVAPAGQMRRGFQYYLERERARAATPFLHFNGWYDMGTNVTEANLTKAITGFGEELVRKRGVRLDSFVLDDGWDDNGGSFWGFDKKKLPNGLKPVRDLAAKYGSRLGIWISPLGGYGEAPRRIANAAKLGLVEKDSKSLDLAYEPYYNWYRDKSLELMRKEGANYFKWDKAGEGVSPHFMALLRVARELHEADPALYMNVTVGTWPSPFWLNHIDCTWRDGADVFWIGKGDKREQWITFRDDTNLGYVQNRAPLYPLNSIMLHGVVLGRHYQAKDVSTAGNDLKHEVRSFFATGTMMQELYLTPDMMSKEGWDCVAESAKWARANAATLADARIFGGKPARHTGKRAGPDGKDVHEYEVSPYGYASWSLKKSIVMVRNPDEKPRDITFDIAAALELPASEMSAKKTFVASYADQRVKSFEAKPGEPVTLSLEPFEVLVFETK